MNKLIELFSGYNTFLVDNKLKLGFGVDIPCYTGDSSQVARIYPGQPVFVVDAVKSVAPFVGCKKLDWTQNGDTVHVVAQYTDDNNELYEVEYDIKCINDISRCDNKYNCNLDVIDMSELKKSKYVDVDQSRYIGDRRFYVVDLFRLGKLNGNQRRQLEKFFLDLNEGKLHKRSSTIYYTDDNEWGIWDYLEAKPLKDIEKY